MTQLNKVSNQSILSNVRRLSELTKKLRLEYAAGTGSLESCLQQHTNFCLFIDFDQIRQSNLITVHCCNCHKNIKLPYEQLTTMYCKDCEDVEVTSDHIQELKQRLTTIKNQLLYDKLLDK